MELVSRQWSGKHKRIIQGINLTSLLWSDGDKHIPCDYRLYEKVVDGATKNNHFRAMLTQALERGFNPKCVLLARGRNHIGLALRAFLRLEMHWFNTGISWYESTVSIVREAVRSYLADPWLTLPPTA